MAKARKKKKLPKDFEEQLETADLATLQAYFATYEIDARGGYSELTALMMPACPDELARWLVAQGADVGALSKHRKSALHERAYFPEYSIQVLIDLGCNIHDRACGATPLHVAAERNNHEGIKLLLSAGARIDEKNSALRTPLEEALFCCRNIDLAEIPMTAELLLQAGAEKTPRMKEFVEKIGQTFEWNRERFNPDFLDASDAGLQQLYKIFEVTPVPLRSKYDGRSPIVAKSQSWQDAHYELWQLLVPSAGAATTVQGEVIRISGKISRELLTNGSGNWDREWRKMANHFVPLIASGTQLSDEQLTVAREFVAELPDHDDAHLLGEMAVAWVKLNPQPVQLGKVDYKV